MKLGWVMKSLLRARPSGMISFTDLPSLLADTPNATKGRKGERERGRGREEDKKGEIKGEREGADEARKERRVGGGRDEG